jgi:hypothetical protein
MGNLFREQNLDSFGYLKTEENSNNRGYISDQRIKDLNSHFFSGLYAHYTKCKTIFEFGLQYGLPGGPPSYSDPYLYQRRLNDYRRVDVGF